MKRMILATTKFNIGDKVTITSKYRGDWDIKGEWGIIKHIDNDEYFVALWDDPNSAVVLSPEEIKKSK